MKNRIIKISILSIGVILFYLLLNNCINVGCIIKKIFSIRCPGCGLTRAFICIFHLNFIKAFHYNILSIPLFLVCIISFVFVLYDIIFNKYKLERFYLKFSNHYKVIIVLLIISMIYANVFKI